MKPGSEEWFRAESIQTMNAVYTAGDEEMITHNQVIESALRRVWNERGLEQAAEILALREALEQIVETHSGYCEHHVGVSNHSYALADIARAALARDLERVPTRCCARRGDD